MSHEIETAVFSALEGAGWTGLGVVIPALIANDPREIAKLCGAVYSVRKAPTFARIVVDKEMPHTFMEVDTGRDALYLDDTNEVFEVVSRDRYSVDNRQPVDIFESFRDELAKSNMSISHAAVLRGGRIVTVCAKLDTPVQDSSTSNADEVLSYVTGSTGYDKQHGTNYFLTSIRTVCANTLAMGLHQAENAGRLFRATAAQTMTATSLCDMLAAASNVIESERDFLRRLYDYQIDNQQVTEFFCGLLDIIPSHLNQVDKVTGKAMVSMRARNQLLALQSAYMNAPGASMGEGTLYGALQAVTYFTDHEATVRDTGADGRVAARLASSMFGSAGQVKLKAVRMAHNALQLAA